MISNDIYSVGLQISLVYSIDNRPPQDGDPVTIPDTQPLFDWALAKSIAVPVAVVALGALVAFGIALALPASVVIEGLTAIITALLSRISSN